MGLQFRVPGDGTVVTAPVALTRCLPWCCACGRSSGAVGRPGSAWRWSPASAAAWSWASWPARSAPGMPTGLQPRDAGGRRRRRGPERLRSRGCGRPRRCQASARRCARHGQSQREPGVHRTYRRRSATGSGRPLPGASRPTTASGTPVERMDMREGRAAVPATPSTRPPPASCWRSGSACTPATPSGCASSARRASPTAAATLLSNFGARLAGAPGSSSSAIDELADGPDVPSASWASRPRRRSSPRSGPDLAPPLHLTPCVHAAATDRRSCPARCCSSACATRPARRVLEGHRTARQRRTRRLRAEPAAADAEGRTGHPGAGHRGADRRAWPLLAVRSSSGQALVRQAFAEAHDDRVLRRSASSATSCGCSRSGAGW